MVDFMRRCGKNSFLILIRNTKGLFYRISWIERNISDIAMDDRMFSAPPAAEHITLRFNILVNIRIKYLGKIRHSFSDLPIILIQSFYNRFANQRFLGFPVFNR